MPRRKLNQIRKVTGAKMLPGPVPGSIAWRDIQAARREARKEGMAVPVDLEFSRSYAEAYAEAYAQGFAIGILLAISQMISRLISQGCADGARSIFAMGLEMRFNIVPEPVLLKVKLANFSQLETWTQRLPDAQNLDAVFG
ncbi:MAG: hypothetical protein FWD57_14435 [Polyangiaceae bacterium]|nr:hypothetical protein [Polyangiaceae bacterium]